MIRIKDHVPDYLTIWRHPAAFEVVELPPRPKDFYGRTDWFDPLLGKKAGRECPAFFISTSPNHPNHTPQIVQKRPTPNREMTTPIPTSPSQISQSVLC